MTSTPTTPDGCTCAWAPRDACDVHHSTPAPGLIRCPRCDDYVLGHLLSTHQITTCGGC